MAKELLNMATDENVSDAVKLKAITEALDRGGVATKSSVEVGISVAPHESIFEQMMTGSRAAYRGETDSDQNPPALVATDHDAIDVAIVEDDLDGDNPANLDVMAYPITPDGYETRSPFDSSPSPFDVEPPATDALMPLDQANAELARLRAAHTPPGHAVSHRGQRALPRGRS
ncbi:hypothetical protein JF710_21205 [Mycobacterium intracellulare]|uniref:hypothetical protein n=1 Tax=Mycobacterium intracellulare TaxID=1767 RepID=UPI001CDB40D5|nr:hypothetical protein [Mycobacterium intracellulare]MCA2255700.1 hypothetical protein [Mycobacterium intracellulare]